MAEKQKGNESKETQNKSWLLSGPVLSTGRGGGALRGTKGEFNCDAHTGSAKLSIPLPFTPDREGVVPPVSLSYDSGNGNGAFGLGWNLGCPRIERSTSRRLPLYMDSEDSDVFTLSGADLVCIAEEKRGTTTVRHYRLQSESQFSRIEFRKEASGETSFCVFGSDGSQSTYGDSAESRIEDPQYPGHVFAYLISRSEDALGNVVRYRYCGDGANRHLEQVLYGNKASRTISSSPDDFHLGLVFAYAERDDVYVNRKPGFEVRCGLRCESATLYHGFGSASLFSDGNKVRSLSFEYVAGCGGISLLEKVVESGHRVLADGSSASESLPPMSFSYFPFVLGKEWCEFDSSSVSDIPGGFTSAEWIDLYGEGIAGLLMDCGGKWYFKHNLGNGRLSSASEVGDRPVPGAAFGLVDIEGNGVMAMVENKGANAGASSLDESGKFGLRKKFGSVPWIDWERPNIKFMDLDGDGRSEIVVAENDRIRVYLSGGVKGYGNAIYRYFTEPGEKPVLVSQSPDEAVFAADMTGDGLADLVRVRFSDVCYWPNFGHGRFGSAIYMDNAPVLGGYKNFNPANLIVADIDGSGTTDLLYREGDRIHIYRNCLGKSFEFVDTISLPGKGGTVKSADVLGKGLSTIVFGSPLFADASASPRYLPVQGGRTNVMSGYSNGTGAQVDIEYTPSTAYYLEDKLSGNPWTTKLPYVVQCVSKVVSRDLVTGWERTETYAYRDGYHDPDFREFRGFGSVVLREHECGIDPETDQDIRETRTDFYLGKSSEMPTLDCAQAMTTRQWQEGCRSFQGMPKSRKILSVNRDGTEIKEFSTTSWTYRAKFVMEARLPGDRFRNGSCWQCIQESETASFRESADDTPRTNASFTLNTDAYGRPLLSASVWYGRGGSKPDGLPDVVWNEQKKNFVTFTETGYTQDSVHSSGKFRMGLLKKTISYEVKGFSASNLDNPQKLRELFADASRARDVLTREDVVFYDDALSAPRADDTCGLAGTVYERYGLAFESQTLSTIYGNSVDASDMAAAGYVLRDGDWYCKSGRNVYAQDAALNFYRPCGIEDAFGNRTSVVYDAHSWLVESVTDAVGNTVSADNDYRYMSPRTVTDANGNRTAVDWTPLGLVSKVALMGKTGQSEGDTLDSPTEEFIYDFDCFGTSSTPIHVRTRRREAHGSSMCRWLESVEYSDGAGRVVLAKAVAEPGKYKTLENGSVVEKDSGTDVRWVGSGRTIYNNAGNPVKQYEPYFSGSDNYESEPAVVETGVTPVLHYDPLDRLVRTDLPDGTFSRAEFATWEQRNFDQDDTVLESAWYADRNSPDPAGNEPANPEKRAAWLAAKHAGTPSVEYLDAQGRPFYSVADNGTRGRYATLTVFDVLGNPLSVTDARGNVVMSYAYNSLSVACRTASMDAGERRTLLAVDGQPVLGFDSRGHRLRSGYDALRRPTEQWLSENGGAEKLVGRTVYGESAPNSEASNLRGMMWKSYDQSGLVENAAYDFKGNLLQGSRQFARAYNQTIDWNVTAPDSLLESETFTTTTAYDALNRATSIRTPHNSSIPASEILPGYNEASLLEKVDVKLRGATTATNFVQNIDYDAKGQRERIQYGNGSTTGYTYDDKTFRLKRLLTTRNNGADVLQDLNYTYDAVGNVTQIDDSAQQTIFFNGSVVSPSQKFEYDALYRLVKATGREHVSVNADSEPEAEGYNAAQISPQDGTAMRNYAREWEYDSVGNILSMIHKFNGSQWTRRNAYATDCNRLNSTAVGQTTASFAYNAHGSMTSMPHLSAMDWDFTEKLCHVTRGTTEAYYNYDGNGIRTRKVVVKNGVTETRLYLGGFEIWRKTVNGALDTERETLHVMDDQKRIAIVETLTVENGNRVAGPSPVQRYQLDNHLGSASLELDASANIISYEEYYPYGDTSYRAGRSASEVSQKRYRYTGKEKDEESSLYYCEQRYYAAHISRWVSTDPTWLEDGINIYAYVHGNPLSGVDPSGMGTENNETAANDEYNDDKAKENLINAIREHVLSGLGDEGRKKVESIIEKIKDGSFDEEIYKNIGRPEKGTDVNPTKFGRLVEDKDLQDLYYIARARDYQIRDGKNGVAQYYIVYGAKYMFRFKYETRNELTEEGKDWLDDTLKNLQNEMEKIISENPKCENIPEKMPNSLNDLAFKSHVRAYVDAGFCKVPMDWWDIIGTPDLSDIKKGIRQGLGVAAECFDIKIFFYNTGAIYTNMNVNREKK
ncbi:SpvB/TcaC N-terminal domain-containing protein [Fibrobacter succinogenes]|uniref:SpvB/TcaC N-terminal domain-containing protein n=1 Tax=Fibrobacter succinogenes TaxID=833 RepID=UPI0026F0AFCC|nr:SpvB/TcaC N-terminal domain-containing protein [Fibrobacter succinogenes]